MDSERIVRILSEIFTEKELINLPITKNGDNLLAYLIKNNGDFYDIKYIISAGSVKIVNAKIKGKTPLYIASEYGRFDIVNYLIINTDVEINEPCSGDYPIYAAIAGGYLEIVKILIEYDANINMKSSSKYDMTPFGLAVYLGHLEMAEYLRENDPKFDINEYDLDEALISICKKGNLESLKYLIKIGIKFDKYKEQSLINVAAGEGHKHIVECLMAEGVVGGHCHPIFNACYDGHLELVEFFYNIDNTVINSVSNCMYGDNWTLLQMASKCGHVEIVKFLLAKVDLDYSVSKFDNKTTVHYAAKEGHLEIIKLLEDDGVDLNVKSCNGTPIELAYIHRHFDIVKYLIECDVECDNLLKMASKDGNLEIVQLLLEQGYEINVQSSPALTLACQAGHLEIAKLLVKEGAFIDEFCEKILSKAGII